MYGHETSSKDGRGARSDSLYPRVAIHAAQRGKAVRLTDEELSTLERDAIAGLYSDDFAIVIDVVTEIRERRAADLTAEEREALEYGRRTIEGTIHARYSRHDEACRRALAALDKLIGGGKQ